jgi:hypothetical protein
MKHGNLLKKIGRNIEIQAIESFLAMPDGPQDDE